MTNQTNGDDLDPESDQIREVFARFGLAIFQAQALERQLAVILAAHYGTSSKVVTRAGFDELLARFFRETLGSLTRKAAHVPEIEEVDATELKTALTKRNWLVHQYFWERAIEFLSESGRTSMIQELRDAADMFDRLDKRYTGMARAWAEKRGITAEDIDNELQKLIRGD